LIGSRIYFLGPSGKLPFLVEDGNDILVVNSLISNLSKLEKRTIAAKTVSYVTCDLFFFEAASI